MWSELSRAIETGAVLAYGATPGWAAWLAAELANQDRDRAGPDARDAGSLVVVVAADDGAARELEDDLRFWIADPRDSAELDPIASLPGIDVSPYAELSPDRGGIVERVATLYRLTQPALRPRIVVTSAEALARRTLPPAELAARGLTIATGRARSIANELAALSDRRRLVAHAGRRRARHVRRARRRGRRLRAARTAPGAHRAVRRRGRVAALVRRRVAAHAARRSSVVHLHPVRETIVTGSSRRAHRGCATTPTRSRSRPRRPAA